MSWTIWFTNGDSEVTPPSVDKIRTDPTKGFLYACSSRSYGSDEIVSTYVLENVRKWEPNQ